MSRAALSKVRIGITVQVTLIKFAWNFRLAIRDLLHAVERPIDELFEIDIPINVAVYELDSRMIEHVDLGGALHYLYRMSLWQVKRCWILFEPQILNGLDERVIIRAARGCGRNGLFETSDSSTEPDLYGSQSFWAFDDVGRVPSSDILVLKASILKKDGRGWISTCGYGWQCSGKGIHEGD
jgi:hypothetical protein